MGESLKNIDCTLHSTREINECVKESVRAYPNLPLTLTSPDSRHNLAVGVLGPVDLVIDGNVGYYCGGLCEQVTIRINGDSGWGLAENLMSGRVMLTGSAGSAAGATLRGGKLIIHGSAGPRCGIAMKGGTIVVGGDVGFMTGFMMQKGVIIVCGDAGDGFGDSLYEGKLFLRGAARSLGSDAVEEELTDIDRSMISLTLADAGIDASPAEFRKIVSGKRLYNFSTKEKEIWKTAL